MIFPERVELQGHLNGDMTLAVYDHPTRRAIEDVILTPQQGRQLLDDLVRRLYPELANETLAHLP